MILVGTQVEKSQSRVVSQAQAKQLADEFNIWYYEVSASTGYNVKELINDIFDKTFHTHVVPQLNVAVAGAALAETISITANDHQQRKPTIKKTNKGKKCCN